MFLFFTPVVAGLVATSDPSRRGLKNAALVLGVVAVSVVPWTIRNYRLQKALVLVSTMRWFPIAEGNLIPRADWVFDDGDESRFAERYFKIPGELEREAFARQVALNAIRAQGASWLPRKIVRNTYRLFSPRRTQLSRYVELRWLEPGAQNAGAALRRLEILYYVPHMVLGILALWLVPAGPLKTTVVALVVFCFAIYIVANANHRFRVPLLPLFSLYAGPLLCGYASSNGRRSWHVAGAAAAVLLFLAIVYAGVALDNWEPHGVPGRQTTVSSLHEVKRLRDLGVARFVVGPPGFTPDDVTRGFEKLGNEVIAKL
jgi:hypothetical protein